MKQHALWLFAVACFTSMLLSGSALGAVASSTPRPNYPAVINVSGTKFYTDAIGSVVSKAAEQDDLAKQAPLFAFLTYEFASLDGEPLGKSVSNPSASCANQLLEEWAKADALRTALDDAGAYSLQGGVNRQKLLRSFVMVALKLKFHGLQLGPDVTPWLTKLVHNNNRSWRQITLRTNLYYWAGATAADFYLLSHDQDSLQFQNQVWSDAISAIHDDGYLDAELARGRRALVYHQYALSAILSLREARRAMGLQIADAEQHRIQLLFNRVGTSLCHPDTMAAAAKVASVEIPDYWGFREIDALGTDLSNDDMKKCSVPVDSYFDINNGGDQKINHAMFLAFAKAAH
jgi:poly(beta-D-mannuronate) lyase